jgi:hypothetical protein
MNCVYKIVCKDPTITEFYIGSTKNLNKRIISHKCNSNKKNYKVYNFIKENGGWDNWNIIVEQETPNYEKYDREILEQSYIELLEPQLNTSYVIGENKVKHKKKTKQWRENNVEHIKEYNEKMKEHYSKWRKDNREELLQKKRDYSNKKIKCDNCGNLYSQDYIKKHMKSKKCISSKLKNKI